MYNLKNGILIDINTAINVKTNIIPIDNGLIAKKTRLGFISPINVELIFAIIP